MVFVFNKLAVRLICSHLEDLILYLDILVLYPRNRSLWLLNKLTLILISSGLKGKRRWPLTPPRKNKSGKGKLPSMKIPCLLVYGKIM